MDSAKKKSGCLKWGIIFLILFTIMFFSCMVCTLKSNENAPKEVVEEPIKFTEIGSFRDNTNKALISTFYVSIKAGTDTVYAYDVIRVHGCKRQYSNTNTATFYYFKKDSIPNITLLPVQSKRYTYMDAIAFSIISKPDISVYMNSYNEYTYTRKPRIKKLKDINNYDFVN